MEFPARLDSPEGMPYDEKCPRSSHCVGPHYATILPHWDVSNGEHGEFTWGILENIPGFRNRKKKSWKMGVDQVDDHDWGYELTKIIPAICCFKMSCTGRPAGPGLLAAARPHNSSYLQRMSFLWFSLHERPSLLLRYLQISNSSSSPADDD